MEARVLIAYALIAVMVAAIGMTIVYYRRKHLERRRIMHGRSRRRTDP